MTHLKKYINFIIIGFLIITTFVFMGINIYLNNKIKNIKVQDENIVFFGDSITEGYNVKEFFDDLNVVNSGISGNKTEDLINRIENTLYDYNPSKVIILIGINDVNKGENDSTIVNNIKKIIKNIRNNRKNAEIYVESIYPINNNVAEKSGMLNNKDVNNKRVKELNKKIKNLCLELDIEYINVFNELIDKDGNLKESYTKDGVHLNDLGYHKVTEELRKYVYQN